MNVTTTLITTTSAVLNTTTSIPSSEVTATIAAVITAWATTAALTAGVSPTHTFPPGYGEPSSAWNNAMHKKAEKMMGYVLLFPFLLIGFGAIVINWMHLSLTSDPRIKEMIVRGETARRARVQAIKIEYAEGKRARAEARENEKERQKRLRF